MSSAVSARRSTRGACCCFQAQAAEATARAQQLAAYAAWACAAPAAAPLPIAGNSTQPWRRAFGCWPAAWPSMPWPFISSTSTADNSRRLYKAFAVSFTGADCLAFSALAFSLGTCTSHTIPSALRVQMRYQVRSISHHSRPWRADCGKAWWLLCQPSPKDTAATHQQLVDRSPANRERHNEAQQCVER